MKQISSGKEETREIMLDMRDKKILAELDINARTPFSAIAKKIKMSKQAVEYRINRLLERGIIKNFYTVVNFHKLGYNLYRIAFKFQNISPEKEKDIMIAIGKTKSVGWVITLNGAWDAFFGVYARNIVEFDKTAKEILYNYSNLISEKSISIVTELYYFGDRYVYERTRKQLAESKYIPVGGEMKEEKIDEQDIKILRMLSLNARVSLVEISDKLDISPKTVDYRIKNMIQKGIICGFKTNIDSSILGYEHYKVFLYLQKMSDEVEKEIFAYIRDHPNIVYCTKAVGIADLEFEMKAKNIMEFYEYMNSLRQEFPDIIKDYQHIIIMKEQLINYLLF